MWAGTHLSGRRFLVASHVAEAHGHRRHLAARRKNLGPGERDIGGLTGGACDVGRREGRAFVFQLFGYIPWVTRNQSTQPNPSPPLFSSLPSTGLDAGLDGLPRGRPRSGAGLGEEMVTSSPRRVGSNLWWVTQREESKIISRAWGVSREHTTTVRAPTCSERSAGGRTLS